VKREKQLTKRERKLLKAPADSDRPPPGDHIHCVACGRHIDHAELDPPVRAVMLRCQHKSLFAACTGCAKKARELLAEHDRTGEPVEQVAAWH
jgi:hypothetical protein